jgi:DNA segregation ATPase FtsK/SpoIIIE, S-DNA-T family
MTYLDEHTLRSDIEAEIGDAEKRRDLLGDLSSVLGSKRVPAADVPARLRDLAPDYPPYRSLNGARLREVLERDYRIKVPSTGNRHPIDPVTVRVRLAELNATRQADAE